MLNGGPGFPAVPSALLEFPHPEPPKTPSRRTFFDHVFNVFSNPFWVALGSIFHPNLLLKTHQNRPKIDAKRHFILGFNFWSIFDAEFHPQSLKNHQTMICVSLVFWKSPFRSWHRFLIRSWCQHASIFLPKFHQKCIQIATWKASIFWLIVASIFYRFSFDLGRQLGTMLAP